MLTVTLAKKSKQAFDDRMDRFHNALTQSNVMGIAGQIASEHVDYIIWGFCQMQPSEQWTRIEPTLFRHDVSVNFMAIKVELHHSFREAPPLKPKLKMANFHIGLDGIFNSS